MSTSVKFFHSTMTGAPVLTGSGKGSLISVLDACLINGWGTKTLDSLVVASDVATATISAGHSFVQHQVVLISGATPSSLNGEWRVTEVTTTTVKFATSGIADQTATGTISMKIAPLGWTKPFSGTNLAAYSIDLTKYPSAPGCYVRVDDNTGTYSAALVGYESMTDINTGTMPFPTSAQISGGARVFRSSTNDATTRPWFVVGDGQFVYVGVAYHGGANNGPMWAAFGAVPSKKSADPYNFIVTGHHNADTPWVSPSHTMSVTSTGLTYAYLARSYAGLGGSVSVSTRTWPTAYGPSGSSGTSALSYPNGADYGLLLCPAQIFEALPGGYRADWPGMFFIPHDAAGKICIGPATPYFDTAVSGFTNKVVGFYPCPGSGYGDTVFGVVAFDLTGPWSH